MNDLKSFSSFGLSKARETTVFGWIYLNLFMQLLIRDATYIDSILLLLFFDVKLLVLLEIIKILMSYDGQPIILESF